MAGAPQKATKRARPTLREPEVAKNAQKLVFDETIYGIRRRDPTQTTKRPSSNSDVVMANLPAAKGSTDADDIADMEASQIWEKLKDTVDDIHASNLRGKERKKYVLEKVVRLGGKAPQRQQHPINIRIGMKLKDKQREAQRTIQAREMDVVVAKQTTAHGNKSRGRSRGSRRK